MTLHAISRKKIQIIIFFLTLNAFSPHAHLVGLQMGENAETDLNMPEAKRNNRMRLYSTRTF